MSGWRVIIGDVEWNNLDPDDDVNDPDYEHHLDETFATWGDARRKMQEILQRRWSLDDCPECVIHAAEQYRDLQWMEPQRWDGDVEGDPYSILPAKGDLLAGRSDS